MTVEAGFNTLEKMVLKKHKDPLLFLVQRKICYIFCTKKQGRLKKKVIEDEIKHFSVWGEEWWILACCDFAEMS